MYVQVPYPAPPPMMHPGPGPGHPMHGPQQGLSGMQPHYPLHKPQQLATRDSDTRSFRSHTSASMPRRVITVSLCHISNMACNALTKSGWTSLIAQEPPRESGMHSAPASESDAELVAALTTNYRVVAASTEGAGADVPESVLQVVSLPGSRH